MPLSIQRYYDITYSRYRHTVDVSIAYNICHNVFLPATS